MSELERKYKETLEDVDGTISELNIEDLKSEGITVRSGDKVIKFEFMKEESITSIEDDIRAELKDRLTEKLKGVRSKVIEKLDNMSVYVETLKKELESKKKEYDRKISSSNLMPDISSEHAMQGLSVVRDSGSSRSDSYMWLFQAVYWPKYIEKVTNSGEIEHRVINSSYSKRLVNHIIITVHTKGNTISNVGVRKPFGLENFSHYHNECWGDWHPQPTWETVDDIIKVAKEAETVLETINTGSLASHSPRGLMRISTLEKHSKINENVDLNFNVNKKGASMGLSDNYVRDDVWSA